MCRRCDAQRPATTSNVCSILLHHSCRPGGVPVGDPAPVGAATSGSPCLRADLGVSFDWSGDESGDGVLSETLLGMLIGYARVSTDEQDLTAQYDALGALGVAEDRIYIDHGRSGTNLARPGLHEALAACREGDTLVVTKLDRLARSIRDARDILDGLTQRGVKLSLGGSVHDPTDPVGRLLFNVLALVAEFEADLIRARTREGMAVARAKGRLKGKPPKLSPNQEKHLVELYRAGRHTVSDLVELFGVGRATVYRAIQRVTSVETQ